MRRCILPRQSYKVTYIRRGDSETWSGSLERGQVFRETESSGVVGYGSYLGRGIAPREEHFAVVTVLVACAPCLFDPGARVDPFIWDSLAAYARTLADAALRDRHPGARVESEPAVVDPRPAAVGRRLSIVEDIASTREPFSGIDSKHVKVDAIVAV